MPETKRWNSFLKDTLLHLLGVIFSLLGVVAATLQVSGVKEGTPRFYVILAGLVLTLIVFTLIATRLQRGPSQVGQIKLRLQAAYFKALDESPLNPDKRIEDEHEQHA